MDNKISFSARPQAIMKKLQDVALCPCKKRFVGSVASFFNDIESQMRKNPDMPDRFVYSLDRQTEIPEKIRNLSVNGKTLGEIDKVLSEEAFRCKGEACEGNKSKKTFIQKVLTILSVENPNSIEIG